MVTYGTKFYPKIYLNLEVNFRLLSIFFFPRSYTFLSSLNYVNNQKGLLGKFSDLLGIFFGYLSEEVAEYCSEERFLKKKIVQEENYKND